MKILVLGAGGTGGYFGGRLAQAGVDVTFLVRPRRAQQIAEHGLVVKSSAGDFTLPARTILAEQLRPEFDLVLLTCKAYDLASALDALAPAMQGDTALLPILNGVAHLPVLDDRFGQAHVLRGLCGLATTLTAEGEIRHTSPFHMITLGEHSGERSPRALALAEALAKTPVQWKLSEHVYQDIWEKYYFLTAMAAINCLLRANVGQIVATDEGEALTLEILEECAAVAERQGHPPSAAHADRVRQMLTERGSQFSASMLRDLERGGAVEADHLVGEMLRHARSFGLSTPLLRIANCHLQAYELRRTASST